MKFLYWSHNSKSEEAVEVSFKRVSANVLLLDNFNFEQYKNGKRFQYHGGHFQQSPAVIVLPYPNLWFVVLETEGADLDESATLGVVTTLPPV